MDKKILFIYPTPITEAYVHLAGLASLVKTLGYKADLIQNTFKKPLQPKDFADYAKEKGCSIACIEMLTIDVLFVYEIVKALKEAGMLVMMIGPHPTDCPEECLEYGADIVIRNEVEGTLKEVCECEFKINRLDYVKGVSFKRDDGTITHTPTRERIELGWLPAPDLTIFDKDLFLDEEGLIKGFHRIFTSRGCPGKCTFCDHKMYEQTMKYRSVDDIIAYMEMIANTYGIDTFSIGDDCFTMNHDFVYEFCDKVKKIKPKITWRANSRANLVTPELLKAMKEAGCHSIAYGIETADPESLIKVKKGVLLKNQELAVKLTYEVGMECYACLMTGFPWETEKHVQSQIDYIKKTWKHVSLYQVSGSLMPFPGTEIYAEYAKQYGFEKYWLKPEFQDFGIQLYQNCMNPYKNSVFYQRVLFDDTYIQEEKFFTYTKGYKKKVREFVWLVGKHNLLFMFPGKKWKQRKILFLSKLSMIGYDLFPNLEKRVGGYLFDNFHKEDRRTKIEKQRDKRRGFVKHKGYTNPN